MGQRLGQHFLHRKSVLERIAAACCPSPCERVIEVGAGKGALTQRLLERARHVIAIEVDPRLIAHLEERFPRDPRLTIVEANILETDLTQWGRAAVAGNLPYYITSPVIERVLRMGHLLERAVVLVQKEVAARLAAKPGTRDFGYLSVQTQVLAESEVLFSVPRDAFHPPPDVDSAVVRLTPRPGPVENDIEGFLRFASASFRQKRKTLRNNLLALYDRAQLDALPQSSKRAEQLSIDELKQIYRTLGPPAESS